MAETELRYPSLRVVMQYLEANTRIELARRCPSLRFLEKAVPLSIDYLFLSVSSFTVNNHTYSLGVLRKYPKGTPPMFKHHQEVNRKGGFIFDLDQSGHWDSASFKPHSPGDIELESVLEQNIGNYTAEEEEAQFEQIRNHVNFLKTLEKTKERLNEIDMAESYLDAWNLKRENIRAPFKMYLQYTQQAGNATVKTEYLAYIRKMYDAMKYLNNYLFAGRKYPLRVRCLKVTDLGGVLRIPESMRISAREIQTGSNVGSITKSLEHLLDHQNFGKFCVYSGHSLGLNFDHPAIMSAESFNISKIPVTGDDFRIVLNDKHKLLTIKNPKLTKDEYIRLIHKMKEDKRELDTCYSFGVDSKQLVKELFKQIKSIDGVTRKKQEKRGCSTFLHTYSMPIDDTSKLSIYCDQYKGTSAYKPWFLYILVEKIEEDVVEKSRKCVIS